MRSHYLFESEFTTPGIKGAHEKGGIEGEVGRFRRKHLVPVPQVESIGELNRLILAGCESKQRSSGWLSARGGFVQKKTRPTKGPGELCEQM